MDPRHPGAQFLGTISLSHAREKKKKAWLDLIRSLGTFVSVDTMSKHNIGEGGSAATHISTFKRVNKPLQILSRASNRPRFSTQEMLRSELGSLGAIS